MSTTLTGVGRIARHILRRDRVRMLVWTLSLTAFGLYFMAALTNVFDEAALAARAAIMSTPTGIVMGGPGYGLDDYTAAVAMANEGTQWVVLALSIMSILHVVRHTRTEEENGLSELVRASAVGRQAPALATLLTLSGLLVAIAALTACGMVAVAPTTSLVDALAMMLGSALIALVFGALALVMCQVTAHARTAVGLSIAAFGLATVIRAAGDVQERGGSPLSWFSPIAWAQQTRAFVDLRWWPLLLAAGAVVVLLAIAAALATRRDFGAGLIAPRPGRADASGMLRGPFALAWVQQRGALLWTGLGLGAMWFGTGTLMSTLDEMVSDLVETNPVIGQLFGTDPGMFAAGFLDVMMMFTGVCCAAYAVVMGQRPRAEESGGRLELTLSAPLGRSRWLTAQLAVAGLGSIALLALSTYAMWAGAVLVGVTDPGLDRYTAAFAGYAPAVLAFLALTAALFGWAPRLIGLAWLPVAFAFVIGMFGSIFDLPDWVRALSPLHGVSAVFTDGVDGAGVTVLSIVVTALAGASFLGFRRRQVIAGS
ncbi:MAG: hypothetical protein R2717_08655 [Schumannella sp.]